MDKGQIYCLISPSGKKYIGQCVCFTSSGKKHGYINRWKQHIRDATKGKDFCRLLNNAIRKYNPSLFKIELLEECIINDLDNRENYYITIHNSMVPNGYNLTSGKSLSRQSQETKDLRRESMLGKNKGKIHDKRQRIREEDNILPKYLRSYQDSSGKSGYRINNHPILKNRSFFGKYKSTEEKLNNALEYLNSVDIS